MLCSALGCIWGVFVCGSLSVWKGGRGCVVGWGVEGSFVSEEFNHLFEVLIVYGVKVVLELWICIVRL